MSNNQTLAQQIRASISGFIKDRLQNRLDKLKPDDPKRDELTAQFQTAAWLEDAARRVRQIQAVTHSLKAIHPDARGTNLYVNPASMQPLFYVGSHVLGQDFATDVVGNAAALDVYKFLKLEVEGRSLLEWLLADEPAAVAALSDDHETAKTLQAAFVGLVQERDEPKATHTRAKQMYWLVGPDATVNADYHLLAPLFATSLAHRVHGVIQEDRFGEANKAARAARRASEAHDGVLREYRGLAVQRLGGTKAQNISQLNSERGGVNYLLSSLPPEWKEGGFPKPWKIHSFIEKLLSNQHRVRTILRELLAFLLSKPPANMETRKRREDYVGQLIDELVNLGNIAQQTWPAGWSADSRCVMVLEEQLWLDPGRAETDEEFRTQWLKMDWPEEIGHRFGNWLNARLESRLPVGDVEQRHWKNELLLDDSEDGWVYRLRQLRSHAGGDNTLRSLTQAGTSNE